MCGPRTVYLCKDWADLPQSPMRRCGGRVKSAAVGIILRGGPGHETGDRDCHRSTAGVLHHRHQRGLRHQRRNGPNCRRPELLIQRSRKCLARRALRGHPKAMRRKIFRQLLRRQAVVGDVSFCVVPAKAGTHNHRAQSRWDRSLQSGLSSSISRIFQSRCQFFNCFSRAIASRGDANVSAWTMRCTPYFLTNSEPRPLRCRSSLVRKSW